MKKQFKKAVAVVMALSMAMGLLATSALAADDDFSSGGGGTIPGGSSSSAPDSYDAVVEYTEDTTVTGETIESTGTDENAVLVATEGITVTLDDVTVTRVSDDSTGGDNSSFYGIGASILVTAGTVIVENSYIYGSGAGAAGVFAYDEGVAYVIDSTIETDGYSVSGGIHVAGGGTLYAWDLDVTTSGGSSAAIRSDRGGGTMVVDGGTYTSKGSGSPAIYSAGTITVNNATLTAEASEAICMEGLNVIRLYDCDLTGNMPTDNEQNDCIWNIILYQSQSGDAEEGNAYFEAVGGSITSLSGGMFYTTNTESTYVLRNVELNYSGDDEDFVIKVTGNANGRGWGSAGSNGAYCTFSAYEQELDGKVIWDSISTLDLYLLEGSTLTGYVVDEEDGTQGYTGEDGYCAVYIDETSTFVVTGDSEITNLYNAGTITDEAGNSVSVVGEDGTVYVEGTSAYTITVESYSTTVDTSGAWETDTFDDYAVDLPGEETDSDDDAEEETEEEPEEETEGSAEPEEETEDDADADEGEGEVSAETIVITGVDDEYTIGVGESITLTPSLGSEAVGGGSDVSTDDLTVSSTSEMSAASALTNLASDQNRSQDAGYIYIGVAVVDGEVNTEYSNWADYYVDGTVTLNDYVSGEGFTAVWASGDGSDVTVTGTIVLDSEGEEGVHASDFTGIGVAVVADSGADVTIEDATIITDGFVRSAAITYSADLTITGTTIVCYGDDPLTEAYDGYYNSASTNMMLSPPWVLGIQGGIRAINVLGDYASVYISDSSITSGGWALISTDGCNYPTIVVADTEMALLSAADEEGMESGYAILGYDAEDYGSGYGIYSIGYAHEYFYGVSISGTTYAAIVRSGDVHYSSSDEYIVYEAGSSSSTDAVEGVTVTGSGANCVINSVFGWLFHSSEEASVDLAEGTEVYTENAVFLYKSSSTVDITVDDSTLVSNDGVILQMMDDDDDSVGMNTETFGFNTVFTENEGIPSNNGTINNSDGQAVVNVTFTDGDYEGDLYNGTGYYNQGGDNLLVTVGEGATLTGDVSATENVHGIIYSESSIEAIEELSDEITYVLLDSEGNIVTDAAEAAYIQFTSFTINQYYLLGHMINFNYYNGYNNVMVTVESGSTWTVAEESLVTCLVVEEGATVYGTLTDNGDGTYTLTASDETVAAGTYGETLSSEGESDGNTKEGADEIIDTDDDTSDEDIDSDMSVDSEDADDTTSDSDNPAADDEDFDFTYIPEEGAGPGSSGSTDDTVAEAAAGATTSVWDAYIEYLVEYVEENIDSLTDPDGTVTLESLTAQVEALTEDDISDTSADGYTTYYVLTTLQGSAMTYEDFAASYVVEDEETEEDTSDDTADTEAPDDEDDADTDEENPAEGDEDFDYTVIPEEGMGPGSSGEMTDTEEGDADADADVDADADADEGGTEEAEPEDGTDETVFTFASSDESVATVTADGVVTGVAEGTAVITITAVVDGETISKDVTINVTAEAAEEEGDDSAAPEIPDGDDTTGDTDEETGNTDEETGGAGTGGDTGAEEETEAEGTEEVTEAEETEEATEAEETEEATEAEETDDESTSAATGDTTNVALWMSLAALALLGLAFVSLKKRFN